MGGFCKPAGPKASPETFQDTDTSFVDHPVLLQSLLRFVVAFLGPSTLSWKLDIYIFMIFESISEGMWCGVWRKFGHNMVDNLSEERTLF